MDTKEPVEEKKEEVKEEVKEENKTENKENDKYVGMTEEEIIILEGRKSKDKKDVYCYVAMAVIAILIIMPPAFRIIFAGSKPKSTIEDIVYLEMNCSHGYFDNKGKMVSEEIVGNYRDGSVQTLNYKFIYDNVTEPNLTDPAVTPLVDLANANDKVKMETKGNTVTFNIDFKSNPELLDDPSFKPYARTAPAQLNDLQNQQFTCTHDSKEVKEDTSKIKK